MRNPFEKQLRIYRPGSLSGWALQSPIPLEGGAELASEKAAMRIFDCELGGLHIIAATGSGRRQELTERAWISVVYVVWGEINILQSGRQVCGSAGGCLFIPQSPVLWQSGAFSVVCIMLPPQRLAALMQVSLLGANSVQLRRQASLAAYSHTREPGHHTNAILDILGVNLRVVAALQNDDPRLIESLALADQLGRIISVLASRTPGDEHSLNRQNRRRQAGMQETLDDLIAFIQANLDQSLNLSILENYTHYSKRALQYAFRQRLGCTVSQWIRSQRLDLAYQCLQQAETSDSVTSIALRCGYRSISLFSIDFQQRFHIKPSHLLRQGRQPS